MREEQGRLGWLRARLRGADLVRYMARASNVVAILRFTDPSLWWRRALSANRATFVRDLCLTLAHCVEDSRLFVILTSYMDESGTHAGSSATIMGAMIGSVSQWQRFEDGVAKLQKQYGFRNLHMKDFKHKSGEFSGWSNEKCIWLSRDMAQLTSSGLMHGSIFTLTETEYVQYRSAPNDPKVQIDSRYGLCFRFCLIEQAIEATRRLGGHKKFDRTEINVVAECGHKNAGAATKIFLEEKNSLRKDGINLLAEITLAKKEDCVPLMVADFLAYSAYTLSDRDPPILTDRVLKTIPQKTGLTFHGFRPGGITQYKRELLGRVEARRAWGSSHRRPSLISEG